MFGRKKRGQVPAGVNDEVDGAAEPADGADGVSARDGDAKTDASNAAGEAATEADSGRNAAHPQDTEEPPEPDDPQDRTDGPFDQSEVEELEALAAEPRVLDLGSVLIPVPEGGQVQVELNNNGSVNGVFVTIAGGRVTMASFAAPKSPGQWRSVIGELADSVRKDGGKATVRSGRWGRELHAKASGGDVRFIGVDGPRWMLRGVAMGPSGSVDDDSELSTIAREMISGAVVRRSDDPMPVRTPLPVTLPKALAEQLSQAQQQQAAQNKSQQQRQALLQLQQRQQQMSAALRGGAGTQGQGAAPAAGNSGAAGGGSEARQNPNGSAMQQLRNRKAEVADASEKDRKGPEA